MSGLVYPFLRLATLRPLYRFLQGPPRHSSGVPTTITESTTSISIPSPVDRIRQRNFDLLFESLERNGNPSRVWANYTNLVAFLGYERLPLEIHQQVLRKCTPSSRRLRASATRRLFAGNTPRIPHMYEGRLQAVVRNIRASGAQPTLDDYNFILEQFAAVGHHFGAMQVYRELTHLGIIPRTKTFGLCLQAIAHRLTLPVMPRDKARRTAATRQMVSDLVNAMKSFNIPFTSVNLDLTMRILKETTDLQSFELLMKWGYGIDLVNPDCPPLEYQNSRDPESAVKLPAPQPFSTAALNTTIDTLGRLGAISRMVQTFEVLTTPLPTHTKSSSYDEDDEDDFGVAAEPTPASTFAAPHASPNTTTYNTLLRHISRAGHAVFARHYLLQAMELERQLTHDLQHRVGKMPLEEVPAPHFGINRGTLLSVFGESNRDKNLGLMRWLFLKFPRIIRQKEGTLKFWTAYREGRQRRKLWPYADPSTSSQAELSTNPQKVVSDASPLTVQTRNRRWTAPNGVGVVFNLNTDDDNTPAPLPEKKFNLDLHIRILQRDLSEIQALQAHVQRILERTTRSIKERLGRRVWHGRDVYLRAEGRRVNVSPEKWEQIVGFRELPKSGKLARRRAYAFPWSEAKEKAARSVESGHFDYTQSSAPEQSQNGHETR
jgi:hypothetical protein